MIRIPFGRPSKGAQTGKVSVVFSDYCRDELERWHDRGEDFDEERFKAAVDLAVNRLRAMEEKEDKT